MMHDFHSIFGLGQSALLYLRMTGALIFGWALYQWRYWKTFLRETTARSWPQTEAAILYGSVTPIANTQMFEAVIVYSYFVEQYREGRYNRDFSSELGAAEFVQSVRGKRVAVKYKPSNPAISVIDREDIDRVLFSVTNR